MILRGCFTLISDPFTLILSQSFMSSFHKSKLWWLLDSSFFHISSLAAAFVIGFFYIVFYIVLTGFVLWARCNNWIPCTNDDFFILGFVFLAFTSGQHVVWFRKILGASVVMYFYCWGRGDCDHEQKYI